jgi:hypothetical protein
MSEQTAARENELEYPGPKEKGKHDFHRQWWAIRLAQAETPHSPQHDRNPERDADEADQKAPAQASAAIVQNDWGPFIVSQIGVFRHGANLRK